MSLQLIIVIVMAINLVAAMAYQRLLSKRDPGFDAWMDEDEDWGPVWNTVAMFIGLVFLAAIGPPVVATMHHLYKKEAEQAQ